jgi:hypothetical protein
MIALGRYDRAVAIESGLIEPGIDGVVESSGDVKINS